MKWIKEVCVKSLLQLLYSYAGVVFLSNPLVGFAIFVCSMLNPNLGLAGLICVISAYWFSVFVGFKDEFLRLDYYIYNPLLVGLSVGYVFKMDVLTAVFVVILGILTFLITLSLSSVFYNFLGLPVLSVPFVLGSFIGALSSYKYSNLFLSSLYVKKLALSYKLPLVVEGFLRSLGAIFFMPYIWAGIVIFCVILFSSRILAFLAVTGYLVGTLTAYFFTGSFYNIFSDVNNFNYILISMALGGVFLIPSPRSYVFSALGCFIATPVIAASKVFWETYAMPVFALPFNLVTLIFLYTLYLSRFPLITRFYRKNPERTLDYFLFYSRRFPYENRCLFLPFNGRWMLWQGFEGSYTHRGSWKYALDFVAVDEEGRTFSGSGSSLEDYYSYRKPVFSPVNGRIVDLVDGVPDNHVGEVNTEDNWGNYVVIEAKEGFYVVLAHFSPETFKVDKGQWIAKGALLGLCGNSGYSPEPHIHMHVQLSPEIGKPTVPFVVESYVENEDFVDVGVPVEKSVVEPFHVDKAFKRKLSFMVEQRFRYRVYRDAKALKELSVKVDMDPDGSFYFTDGESKLYFYQHHGAFYFYSFEGRDGSLLKLLFMAFSKVPLGLREGLKWRDVLPVELVADRFKRFFYLFAASFRHDLAKVTSEFCALGASSFEAEVSFKNGKFGIRAHLSPVVGFDLLEIHDKNKNVKWLLERIE